MELGCGGLTFRLWNELWRWGVHLASGWNEVCVCLCVKGDGSVKCCGMYVKGKAC